ncbi:MAG: DUF2508 family protein [Chitinophagales bacterium]
MNLMDLLLKALKGFFYLRANDDPEIPTDLEILAQAQKEWHQATLFFEEVIDPELIDYAVYNLKAAEKKYSYLLNKFRVSQNCQCDDYIEKCNLA